MLEVVLKANNKNITFIRGSSTIGANDDFVQSITVKAETPLTTLEELYVKFSNDALGETRQERLLGANTYGYKVNIPQELIDFGANTWKWRILRRRYSSDRQSYTEIGSYLYTLTVGEGLKNTNGENVKAAELQTLYLSAMENAEKARIHQVNAATSQNRAEEFAGLASTSEINAGISERNAKASEEAALESRNTAFAAATTAVTSAENAAAAAESAKQHETAASEFADTAEAAKEDAGEYKAMAGYYRQQAENASNTAVAASNEATAARDLAFTYQENALNAQTQAEAAKTIAEEAANYVSTSIRDVAKAKSFDDYYELVNHLQTAVLEIPYAEGQPFYIIATDVPDLWVSGVSETNHSYSFSTTTQFLKDLDNNSGKLWVGKYQLSKLETAKVYLGDLQKQTDNRLQTSSKDVVTAINEVRQTANTASGKVVAIENAKGKAGGYASLGNDGKVLENQLPDLNYQRSTDERLTTDSKEIVDAINELDGRLDNIGEMIEEKVEPLVEDVGAIEQVLSQAKVQETAFTVEAYNSRTTAGGKNVLNGSKAKLHKVVGSTVVSKNLIPYPYEVLEGDYAGLTYNANADGSILLKGKSSNATSINLASIELSPNTYYFKNGRTNEGAYAFIRRANGTMISYDNSFVVVEEKETVTFGVYTGYDNEVNYTIYPMLSTENIAWQPYFGEKHASFGGIRSTGANGEESVFEFPKTEVPGGAEIDIDLQVIVNADGTKTPFTDEMKKAVDGYKVWAYGTETVLENNGVNPTFTQSYTVVNKIGSGGSSSGGGTGSGGISQSEVQYIADSYATQRANEALSSAKAYTDEKLNGVIEAMTTINSELEEVLGV